MNQSKSIAKGSNDRVQVPMEDPNEAAGLAYLVLAKLQSMQGELSSSLKKIQSEMINDEAKSSKLEAGAEITSGSIGCAGGLLSAGNQTGVATYLTKGMSDHQKLRQGKEQEISEMDTKLKEDVLISTDGKKLDGLDENVKKDHERKKEKLTRELNQANEAHNQSFNRLSTISQGLTTATSGMKEIGQDLGKAASSLYRSNQQLFNQMQKGIDQNASSAVEFAKQLSSENPGAVALAGARG